MNKCPHCIHRHENGGCTKYDDECTFEPTEECKKSPWWKWMKGEMNVEPIHD